MATTSAICSFSHHFLLMISSFLLLISIIDAAAAAAVDAVDNNNENKPTELVDMVCHKTSMYSFCVNALYSDSRTGYADQQTLAYISVGLAYTNATSTRDHISKLLANVSNSSADHRRLMRCAQHYKKAISCIEMAYNDLDSETYYELADLATEAATAAKDCEAMFKGVRAPPLSKRNHDLMGLCDICGVVAKLFTGSF